MPQPRYSEEEFRNAITSSKTIREALLKLGLTGEGGNYKVIHRAIKRCKIDISHMKNVGHARNILSNITVECFANTVINSTSYANLLKNLGIKESGGSNQFIRKFIKKHNLDISHFTGQGWSAGKTFDSKIPIDDYFNGKRTIQSHKLKLRLIKDGVFTHTCSNCNLQKWCDKPIPLELDHINGNHEDNQKENLRLLCANCHAQTDTYCGKNKGTY